MERPNTDITLLTKGEIEVLEEFRSKLEQYGEYTHEGLIRDRKIKIQRANPSYDIHQENPGQNAYEAKEKEWVLGVFQQFCRLEERPNGKITTEVVIFNKLLGNTTMQEVVGKKLREIEKKANEETDLIKSQNEVIRLMGKVEILDGEITSLKIANGILETEKESLSSQLKEATSEHHKKNRKVTVRATIATLATSLLISLGVVFLDDWLDDKREADQALKETQRNMDNPPITTSSTMANVNQKVAVLSSDSTRFLKSDSDGLIPKVTNVPSNGDGKVLRQGNK